METIVGIGSKMGQLMKKKGTKNRRPLLVPASPGLQGKGGEQQQYKMMYINFYCLT